MYTCIHALYIHILPVEISSSTHLEVLNVHMYTCIVYTYITSRDIILYALGGIKCTHVYMHCILLCSCAGIILCCICSVIYTQYM